VSCTLTCIGPTTDPSACFLVARHSKIYGAHRIINRVFFYIIREAMPAWNEKRQRVVFPDNKWIAFCTWVHTRRKSHSRRDRGFAPEGCFNFWNPGTISVGVDVGMTDVFLMHHLQCGFGIKNPKRKQVAYLVVASKCYSFLPLAFLTCENNRYTRQISQLGYLAPF
jgi:hypothetical protein